MPKVKQYEFDKPEGLMEIEDILLRRFDNNIYLNKQQVGKILNTKNYNTISDWLEDVNPTDLGKGRPCWSVINIAKKLYDYEFKISK